jgi:hypothetical protein
MSAASSEIASGSQMRIDSVTSSIPRIYAYSYI